MFHEYEYPGVPPAGVTVAVPLQFPLQSTSVPDAVAVKPVGSVMVALAVCEQPPASVTVTL